MAPSPSRPGPLSGSDGWQGRFARCSRDRGSAVVEFVMIAVLLAVLLFGVLQVAALFYVRNVVAASAADGARYAASADVDVSAGADRADSLIASALAGPARTQIRCTSAVVPGNAPGLQFVEVRCTGRIRSIFLPIGEFTPVNVVAHALKEPA